MTRRHRFTPLAYSLVFLAAALAGCSASGGNPADAGPATRDSDLVPRFDAGDQTPECASDEDCGARFLCAAVDGVPVCVPDPDPPPPGDGTDCSPCPAPGECRGEVCIQPSVTGEFCEFDDACADGELCIAGRCTPDPRVPTPCVTDADCYGGLTCSPEMFCECTFTTDCPSGLECIEGVCTPDECVADDECEEGFFCDSGTCRDDAACGIVHPDLTGEWSMESELRVREALPDWLDSFLSTIEEPLRFLAGDASCIDFGLPSWVETEICDLVRPLIEEYIPEWALPVFRAIADMNDVLSTWEVQETMVLEEGGATDAYRGTHTWDRITFYYRGMPLMGTPETIRDWRFNPSPFNASAVCGVFNIDRHDVDVSIGAIIAWAVDALVWALTEGEHDTLGGALSSAAGGFCRALGDFAESVVDYGGVGDTVFGICVSQIESLVNRAVRELIDARIGISPITLRGHGDITGPNSIRMGVWDGTLLGSEFGGNFQADR